MFETTVYADMGSAFTKLWARGEALCDESRVALDPQNNSMVLAVGGKSRQLLNTCAVYPVRGGAVANPALAAIMLRRMTLDMLKRKTLCGIAVRLLLPPGMSAFKKLCAVDTAKQAGFRSVRTVDALSAGARGSGLDIDSPSAFMIADLGRDKLSTEVCANGGALSDSLHSFGSADFEKTLQAYFAAEHGMLIGARTAETVKQNLGMPNIPVCGRSASTGAPQSMLARSSELRAALSRVYDALASELTEALNITPPEAAADICDNGITLVGGGAVQYGLCRELESRLKVPVKAASNAPTAAVYGAAEGLKRSPRRAFSSVGARAAGLA